MPVNLYDFMNDLTGITMVAFGRPFTYQRGALTTSITGVPGSDPVSATEAEGVYLDGSQRQFVFPVSGFPYDYPVRNDRIIDERDTEYVVTDPIYTVDEYASTFTVFGQRDD